MSPKPLPPFLQSLRPSPSALYSLLLRAVASTFYIPTWPLHVSTMYPIRQCAIQGVIPLSMRYIVDEPKLTTLFSQWVPPPDGFINHHWLSTCPLCALQYVLLEDGCVRVPVQYQQVRRMLLEVICIDGKVGDTPLVQGKHH